MKHAIDYVLKLNSKNRLIIDLNGMANIPYLLLSSPLSMIMNAVMQCIINFQ